MAHKNPHTNVRIETATLIALNAKYSPKSMTALINKLLLQIAND